MKCWYIYVFDTMLPSTEEVAPNTTVSFQRKQDSHCLHVRNTIPDAIVTYEVIRDHNT